MDVEILPAFPEMLLFLESCSSKDDETVIDWGCVFEAEDFAGTCAFLAAAEASSSDEGESEDDGVCVFFSIVVEFKVDFGVTEDICSLGFLVLEQVFKLELGFEDFFIGTLSSSEEEHDESEEEVFLVAGCLDAATCACLGLDLGGAGF